MPGAEPPDRYAVERMVEASGLPTCSRDILYALARRMDQGSILIPGRYSPSLYRMAEVTGWSKRHIQRHLARLEASGLIVRSRSKGRRTAYAVVWPALEKLGTQGRRDPERTRDTESYPVGTPGPGTRDTASPELGTRGRETRDTAARSQTSQLSPDLEPDPEITMVRRLLMARTGSVVTAAWASATRDTIVAMTGAPATRGPGRSTFIRQVLTRDTNPKRWLPTPAPPPYREEERHD
jgi:hypothetical protein